jgi:general secretion pathway protein A
MYRSFYKLRRKPFALTPDPKMVYMSEAHQEALAVLRYGVVGKKGFLVLTGDVGTGKTTLLQTLILSLEEEIHLCMINNPVLKRDEFFSMLARSYDLVWEGNKAYFLIEFGEFLKKAYHDGERVLLIIDEAHALSVDLLEEIRLLSNQVVVGQDVLSIFLVGQPELNPLMGSERLLSLRQRVGIRFHLKPFSLEETKQYILYRLRRAGANNFNIFSEDAVAQIYQVSKGTPRLINIVCDHALLSGFSKSKAKINGQIIKECVRDLQFPGEKNQLPVAPELQDVRRIPLAVKISVIVLLLFGLLLLFELLPAARPYSLLGAVLPDTWLQHINKLSGYFGG